MLLPMIEIRGIFLIFCFLAGVAASNDKDTHDRPLIASLRREPNNVQCFKNSDCLSDCCISNNGWVGICVGKPQIGQICGLFTTANSGNNNLFGSASQQSSNPWGSTGWSYGGVLGNILMNQGGGGQGGAPQPSARPQQNTGNTGAWVADLSALLTNNPSGSGSYESSGMLQGYHHNGGGAGMEYNGGNYGHHQQSNGGYNMNSFDLSSLKYGNKFGKRFNNWLRG